MLHPFVITVLTPVIAQFMAGTGGAPAAGGEAPTGRRPPTVLPMFPALGVSPTRVPEAYQLREAGDGSGDLLYDAQGFSARVARDGGVSFKDHHVSALNFLGGWLPKGGPRNVPSLQATLQGLARKGRVPRVNENAQTDDKYLVIPNLTRYRPDPREGCRACAESLTPMLLNVTGRFDLTDELMRFARQDPYRYEKARFLATTREARIERAVASHATDVRRAAAELPGLLNQIACDAGLTRQERREIIEKLRAELDGESPEARTAAQQIDQFLVTRFASPVAGDGCPPSTDSP